MRRPVVLVAATITLSVAALGACRRERSASPPPPAAAAASPDPRLQAAFTDIFRSASVAAGKARELHERHLLSATRPDE